MKDINDPINSLLFLQHKSFLQGLLEDMIRRVQTIHQANPDKDVSAMETRVEDFVKAFNYLQYLWSISAHIRNSNAELHLVTMRLNREVEELKKEIKKLTETINECQEDFQN
jgi:predicted HAD superfamily phosphohydrolase